jgi:hypothetical protein
MASWRQAASIRLGTVGSPYLLAHLPRSFVWWHSLALPYSPPPTHTHAMHMRTQHAPQSPVAVNAQRVFIEAQTKPCSRAIEAGTEVADEASTEVINEANIEVTSEANSEVKNEACKRSEPTCRNEAITKCRISTKRSQDRMTQRRCNRSEKRSKKRSSQHVSKRR